MAMMNGRRGDSGLPNNTNIHEEAPSQTLVDAEIAPDIEQVVQDVVQRAVREALEENQQVMGQQLHHHHSSQQPPMAIVIDDGSLEDSQDGSDVNSVTGEEEAKRCYILPKRYCYCLLMALAVVTIAGAIVASPLGEKESTAIQSSFIPSAFPSMSPTDDETISRLIRLLYPDNNSKEENLFPAQLDALYWMVEEDHYFELEKFVLNDEFLERHALVTMYYGLGGDAWILDGANNTSTIHSWLLANVSHCQWEHVECHENKDSVIRLSLGAKGLRGSLPTEIGSLTNLQELLLQRNAIQGSIPSEIGLLTKMERVLLNRNQLSESIPSSIGQWKSIQTISFYDNSLSGTLPTEVGNWEHLEQLSMGYNSLEGRIPSELTRLKYLQLLNLYNNTIEGQIPTEIGRLTGLTWLILNQNDIGGPLPSELGNLQQLESLYLEGNRLSATIPSELGNLRNLQYLYLHDNRLQGPLRTELGQLTSLYHLRLGQNQFSSSIPAEFSNLDQLGLVGLASNMLTGAPSPLEELPKVEVVYLFSNNFTSGFETLFCNTSSIEVFEADCQSTGLICNCCTDCK